MDYLKSPSRLDEIVFENRNKAYGAYAMRAEYNRTLSKALFIGVSIATFAILTPFILSSIQGAEKTIEPTKVEPAWVFIDPVVPEEKKIEEPVAAAPVIEKIKTVDTRVPEPKRVVKKEYTPPTVVQKENATPSVVTSEGEEVTSYVPVPVVPVAPKAEGTGVATEPVSTPVTTPPSNEVLTSVDVKADFQGGIDRFRSQVTQRFDTSNFENSGEVLKTNVRFIVERDGTLSGIKASGPDAQFNKEAERTISRIKGKWQPAKVDGKPVRSFFNFPVSMMFE